MKKPSDNGYMIPLEYICYLSGFNAMITQINKSVYGIAVSWDKANTLTVFTVDVEYMLLNELIRMWPLPNR